MSDKRKREFMEKLESCYKVVQQSSAKGIGISAVEVANQLNVHRTTAHSYLNTLEFMGKVYSEKGLWYAKEIKEKETLILDQTFKEWFLKKLEEVIELNSDVFSDFAFRKALNLYAVLPAQTKSKIENDVSKILEDVNQQKISTFNATLRLNKLMTESLFK